MITSGNRPTSFGLGEGALCRKQDTWHSLPWTVTCTVHTQVQSEIARTLVRLCVITCTGLQNSSLHSGTCLRVGFFFFLVGLLWLSFNFFKTLQSSRGIQLQSSSFLPFLFFQKMCFCHHQHLSREKSMVTRKMTQQRRFCHYCYKTFRRMCTHYSSAVQDDIYFSFNLFKKVVLK